MKEITVKVPDDVADLIEDEVVERGAIRSLAKRRLRELEADREEAQRHIAAFEERYGTGFEEFEASFDDDASRQAHEDYNEWSFWVETEREVGERISAVKSIK